MPITPDNDFFLLIIGDDLAETLQIMGETTVIDPDTGEATTSAGAVATLEGNVQPISGNMRWLDQSVIRQATDVCRAPDDPAWIQGDRAVTVRREDGSLWTVEWVARNVQTASVIATLKPNRTTR